MKNGSGLGPDTLTRRQLMLAGAALAGSSSAALGDDYPNRPIRLVVPFGAGSIADIAARKTVDQAGAALGQAVYIENRPGAAGAIGANVVAKAPPDGYTLCLGTVASHSIAAATVANLPYDPLADFTAVACLISTWSLLVVNKDVPAKSLPEYLDYARRKGHSQYVTGGIGTTTHLVVELMRVREKAPLEHVPVANVGNAFTDLVAGRVDMMSYPALALQAHIESGAVRPLAVASDKRVPTLPDVPTIVEMLKSNEYDLKSWFGVFAPANTPKPIIMKVASAFTGAIQSASADMQKLGAEPLAWGPEQFDTFFRAELPRWREVVRLTGTGPTR
jgi:tripartite-type tricarboxylate transporter receptor subunit TctC